MCYYIGIQDLAAKAMIEMLKSKDEKVFAHYTITLREHCRGLTASNCGLVIHSVQNNQTE